MGTTEPIIIRNRPAIAARAAAERTVCTREYISILCRAGKLEGAQLANASWYVFIDSFETFLADRAQRKQHNREAIRALRRIEIACGEILTA